MSQSYTSYRNLVDKFFSKENSNMVTSTQRTIIRILSRFMDMIPKGKSEPNRYAVVSMKTLARETNLHIDTVRKNIKALKNLELLVVFRNWKMNVYTLGAKLSGVDNSLEEHIHNFKTRRSAGVRPGDHRAQDPVTIDIKRETYRERKKEAAPEKRALISNVSNVHYVNFEENKENEKICENVIKLTRENAKRANMENLFTNAISGKGNYSKKYDQCRPKSSKESQVVAEYCKNFDQKPKKGRTSKNPKFPDWFSDEMRQEWFEYISHLTKIGKPIHIHAYPRLFDQLRARIKAGDEPITIIRRSKEKGWVGFFEISKPKTNFAPSVWAASHADAPAHIVRPPEPKPIDENMVEKEFLKIRAKLGYRYKPKEPLPAYPWGWGGKR